MICLVNEINKEKDVKNQKKEKNYMYFNLF